MKKLCVALLAVSSLMPAAIAQPRDVRNQPGPGGPLPHAVRPPPPPASSNIRQPRRNDWRRYRNYDYNRPGPGGTYFADHYYRDGRYYRERRLGRNDRIYRGRNGRYYCRRSDGTTGLIIGSVALGLLGNALDNGDSAPLGTLLGASAGALLGREIDRGNLRCR